MTENEQLRSQISALREALEDCERLLRHHPPGKTLFEMNLRHNAIRKAQDALVYSIQKLALEEP